MQCTGSPYELYTSIYIEVLSPYYRLPLLFFFPGILKLLLLLELPLLPLISLSFNTSHITISLSQDPYAYVLSSNYDPLNYDEVPY